MKLFWSCLGIIATLTACGGGGPDAGVSVFGAAGTPAFSGSPTPGASGPTGSADTATCSLFVTQEDAQAYFFANGAGQLDADNDGVACEELPRRAGG